MNSLSGGGESLFGKFKQKLSDAVAQNNSLVGVLNALFSKYDNCSIIHALSAHSAPAALLCFENT